MATSDEARRERVAKALGNVVYFGELYIRPHDEHWVEPLPELAHEMAAFMLTSRRGVVILPPEFLKTTIGSQVLPLWLTFRYAWAGRLLRGMLLAEEEGMSQANLSVVSWHIENNDQLLSDFSDDKGRPLVFPHEQQNVWREDAIIVNRAGASKDPTWQAKGLNSSGIHGRRLDWLIADDLVTPGNAFSPAKRRDALNLWDTQITTRLVANGRAIALGNFNHEKDLMSTLAERRSYRLFRRPALHKKINPEEPASSVDDEDAVELWPKVWPRERLAQEAEDKPATWRRVYLLDPSSDRGGLLSLDWLKEVADEDMDLTAASFLLSLDPAIGGESNDLDYFNVSVLAAHGPFIDLVESFDIRGDTPDHVGLVAAVHDRFQRLGLGVAMIVGAKVAMDKGFRDSLGMVRPDLKDKIKTVSTPNDKVTRLSQLGPLAKAGVFRVVDRVLDALTSDPEDQFQELTFAQQWRLFPAAKHDDKLDGLDVGIRGFREHGVEADVEFELVAQ